MRLVVGSQHEVRETRLLRGRHQVLGLPHQRDADNRVSLNVADTRYTMSQRDSGYASDYAQYWYSKGQTAPTFGLNPGSTGPVHALVIAPAIPKRETCRGSQP